MSHKVKVGDEEITLEPFSGRKAIRVIRTIEHITKGVPAILDRWADFTREYEARNVTEMDRATARHYYRPDPVMDEVPIMDGDGNVLVDALGQVLVRRTAKLDDDNRPVMGPDPLGHMTDEDWAASGNTLRLPKSPGTEEQIAAIFPMAMELAEKEVTELLALLVMSNAELKRKARDGSLKDYLEERADEILDAPATDLIELAVAAGEMVDDQFTSKVKQLGDRLPNALRLLGIKNRSQTEKRPEESLSSEATTSSDSSSETKPISSTDSPLPTGGTSEPRSTEAAGSSSPTSLVA